MASNRADALAIKLQGTTDAEVWADEFMRVYGQRKLDIDRYVMITWFANAIQTAVTHTERKYPPVLKNYD